MPVGNIFVSHSGRDVKHDYGALALDVVTVTEAAEFLLAGRIPYIEPKITQDEYLCLKYQSTRLHPDLYQSESGTI